MAYLWRKDRPKRELIGLNDKSSEQFDKIDPEKYQVFYWIYFQGISYGNMMLLKYKV